MKLQFNDETRFHLNKLEISKTEKMWNLTKYLISTLYEFLTHIMFQEVLKCRINQERYKTYKFLLLIWKVKIPVDSKHMLYNNYWRTTSDGRQK